MHACLPKRLSMRDSVGIGKSYSIAKNFVLFCALLAVKSACIDPHALDRKEPPMSQSDTVARLEQSTIQPIPDAERHGRASDLFTIWFGSNIMLLTIVTGALAVTVFKQPFW